MTPSIVLEMLERQFNQRLAVDTIIHVGANIGQEVESYAAASMRGYHVEAMPREYAQLKARCDAFDNQKAVNAVCDAKEGETVEFKVVSNSYSSSLLELGRHAVAYPGAKVTDRISLTTTTLDGLVAAGQLPEDPEFLVLDVQGAEHRVLAGGAGVLSSPRLWGVIVEVSLEPLYEGGATLDMLTKDYFGPNGFYLKSANFNVQGWTDAVFLKRWWRREGEAEAPLSRCALLAA